MTKIYYVRHGQTAWNASFRYQGQTDVALDDVGLAQAQRVARRFKGEKVAAVITSDLCRAKVTAEAIAAVCKAPLLLDEAFREVNFGLWEGLSYSTIRKKWPEIMSKLYDSPAEILIPQGESFNQVQVRAMQAVDRLIEAYPDQTVVVVSHGATIRTILCHALELGLNKVWNIRQDNTAVNLIEYIEGKAMLALVNDTHHLRDSFKMEENTNV